MATVDSVRVSLNDIRIANIKMTKAKLYKDIITNQDSIIQLQELRYNSLKQESVILQDKLYSSGRINNELKVSLDKIKRRELFIAGGAVVSTIGFVVLLVVK